MSGIKRTPVTMLSGFLGSGKTTLLRYLLENSTEKIACIVNDVASINIDAKLVRNDRNRNRTNSVNTTADLADTIELQNGCACCSIQDELFASLEQVLAMGDRKGDPYARIVLENSGVAEPHNIRDKFNEAVAAGHPVTQRVALDTMVTVVDCGSFLTDYASRAPLAARPELGDGGSMRPVVDLLVEQIECADFIVLNKTDMLKEGELDQLVAIVASLNPLAQVFPCEQGKVPIAKIFGSNVHSVVAKLNIEGQHRGAVAAAKAKLAAEQAGHHDHAQDGHTHEGCKACDHDHDHHHKHKHDGCEKCEHGEEHVHEGCEKCEHDHDHDHDHHHHHKHEGCEKCEKGEEHTHDGCQACEHDHDHDHDHKHHKHEHSHERQETTAAKRFGIRSFVYTRRMPFHPQRLKELVLKWLPVSHNKELGGTAPGVGDSPIKSVLRSKGFMWMSSSHSTAYYWSHAGQHFEIRDEGDWWAAVEDADWPTDPAPRNIILQDFEGEYGDRRQEIVFIGVGMDEAQICKQLDGALLTEDEMAKYRARWAEHADPPHPAAPAAMES